MLRFVNGKSTSFLRLSGVVSQSGQNYDVGGVESHFFYCVVGLSELVCCVDFDVVLTIVNFFVCQRVDGAVNVGGLNGVVEFVADYVGIAEDMDGDERSVVHRRW